MENVVRSLLVALFALSGVASAQPPPPHQQGAGEPWSQELGLSEEQMVKLREAKEDAEDLNQLRERAAEAQRKLNEMIRDKSYSKEEILQQADRLNDTQLELRRARLETILRVRDVLGPEQIERFSEMVGVNRESGPPGHEDGPGFRGPPPRPPSPGPEPSDGQQGGPGFGPGRRGGHRQPGQSVEPWFPSRGNRPPPRVPDMQREGRRPPPPPHPPRLEEDRPPPVGEEPMTEF